MILEINQTRANFAAEFEIRRENKITFKGLYSWQGACLECKLVDGPGNTHLHMRLTPQSETEGAAIMPEGDIGRGDEFNCAIMDGHGVSVGAMCCPRMDGSSSYRVKSGAEEILLYAIDKGNAHHVLIFVNGRQVGQIEKRNAVEGNKDRYSLYLLDECERFAGMITLFTIYYDSYNYGNYGEFVASKTHVGWGWSENEFSELYDKGWLSTHFYVPVDTKSESVKVQLKKRIALVFGIVLGGGMIATAVYFMVH
jgi:hypothetical protein